MNVLNVTKLYAQKSEFYVRWIFPNFKKKKLKKAGGGGSHLESQHFGRLRQKDHLKSGVWDQPGQHGENPSVLKLQN